MRSFGQSRAVHISSMHVSSQPLTTVNSLGSQDSRNHAYRTCRDTIASLCVCRACVYKRQRSIPDMVLNYFSFYFLEKGLSLNQELTDCLDHLASEPWSPPTSGSLTPQYLAFTYVGPGN